MAGETYGKSPAKTTKIHPEFTAGHLTNYSGLVPFGKLLLDKLGFGQTRADRLDLGMGSNCSYADGQVFGLVVFGYLCGYRRLAHFEQLSRDTTVQKLLGLEGPIDENTLARRVKKAGQRQSVQLGRVTGALAERVRRADAPPGKAGSGWILIRRSRGPTATSKEPPNSLLRRSNGCPPPRAGMWCGLTADSLAAACCRPSRLGATTTW